MLAQNSKQICKGFNASIKLKLQGSNKILY